MDFKQTMESWFAATARYTVPDSVSSVFSRDSHQESHHTRSSVVSAKIAKEQEKAALAMRDAALKKKQAIGEAKLRLKQQEFLLLEEEIAISDAQSLVLETRSISSTSHRNVKDLVVM